MQGTGAIRRLFRRGNNNWGIDTIISPTTRAVRTAPAACEYQLPGIEALPGTPGCNVGGINFRTLDGGVTNARLVSTPTALLHDPWLDALWFFDGPVLRALQLRKVNGVPTASFVQTKMTNSSGGAIFADPTSINSGELAKNILDFGIQDGLGAVGDASDAFSYTQPTEPLRTLVAGLVSPFQGYSMGACAACPAAISAPRHALYFLRSVGRTTQLDFPGPPVWPGAPCASGPRLG